jgi:hypothetical protein
MGTFIAIQRGLGRVSFAASVLGKDENRGDVIHQKGGMRFARGTKIRFDAEMQLDISSLEPDTAAFCQFGRLGDLGKAKNADVKCAGFFFLTRRHCILDVIKGQDCHGSIGYPASFQAVNPPRSGVTLMYPFCKRRNAARALVCSFSQVQ